MIHQYRGARRSGSFWQRHSLSLVLAGILVVQTIAALAAGHHVWVGEQEIHGQPLDPTEFWIWWFWEYNLSIVADTYGVILIVLLSKRLVEEDSAESKQSPSSSQ
jgi:hypothetical protein